MEVVFENVVKRYGDVKAVKSLNLTIESGALHFLLGPSGCGKTTTLRMLAGLETPSEGRILIGGRDVTRQPAADRGIGMVFQNYALWPHMSVLKNIEYGLKLKKLGVAETKRRVDEVLEITQLGQYIHRMPGQLSGGQQQRVALARALAIRPTVLLLDEPLSNLDAKLRMEMRDNISRIHRQTGITTVYVTHDQKEALSMGTAVSVMHAGNLIQTDSPRRLYHHPRTPFIAGFIGETNLIPGKLRSRNGQAAEVQTSLGTIRAGAVVDGVSEGDPVMLSIRPEAFRIRGAAADTAGSQVSLRLEHTTYLGEVEQLQLTAPDGVALKATLFHAPEEELKRGAQVTFSLAAADVLVLPHQEELGSGT